jgi:hypothetical protein
MSGNDEKPEIKLCCPVCGSTKFIRSFWEDGTCRFDIDRGTDWDHNEFEWDGHWRCAVCNTEPDDDLKDFIDENWPRG